MTEELIAYREDLVENKIPTLGRRAPQALTLPEFAKYCPPETDQKMLLKNG